MANSYWVRLRNWWSGETDSCAHFSSFTALLLGINSTQVAVRDQALQCLYVRHLGVAQQLARQFQHLPDETVTDNLLDVLIVVCQRIRAGQTVLSDEIHLRNYIRRSLKNQLITSREQQQRMQFIQTDDLDFIVPGADIYSDPEAVYWQINEAVAQALRHISTGCQQKLLWLQDGLSYTEIAKRLDIEATYIKQAILTCRKQLKAELLKAGITVNWPKTN